MALPPTMIYAYITSPERTFALLREDGLLREGVDEAELTRAMLAVEESFQMPPGRTGPNLTDLTALALDPFLNDAGRALARTPRYSPAEGGGEEAKPELP